MYITLLLVPSALMTKLVPTALALVVFQVGQIEYPVTVHVVIVSKEAEAPSNVILYLVG